MKLTLAPFFFLTIVVTILFVSCDPGEVFNVTRIIANNTSHDLSIEVYRDEELSESYSIKAFESDTTSGTCSTGPAELCFGDGWEHHGADSVIVSFNDERAITYCGTSFGCLINGKSIMDSLFDFEKVDKNTFLFEITNEEYDVAIPFE